MTEPAADPRRTARWVRAILVIFFVVGFGFGGWLSRLPALRDELGASTLQMSVYGLCLAAGSLLGIVISGRLIDRAGPRRIMFVGLAAQVLALPGAAALLLAGAIPLGLVVLFAFGLAFSLTDVAMNVSGAAAERADGRPRLSLMHAFYSIGVVAAMGLGAAAEALGVGLTPHFLVSVAIIAAASFSVLGWVPVDERASQPRGSARPRTRYTPWRDRRVLLLGVITLSAGLIEGTPADWLPLALVDGRGVSNEFGAVVLGVFFASVVAARLAGGTMILKFGRVATLRGSLTCAVVGVLVVLLAPSGVGIVLGTVLWGLGTGVCWPIAISSAADRAETAARDVAAVSAIGYTSMLLGPMAFGFLGEHFGLLQTFWLLLVFAALALLLSGAARPTAPSRP